MRVVEPSEFKGLKQPKKQKRGGIRLRWIVFIVAILYVSTITIRPTQIIAGKATVLAPTQTKAINIAWPKEGQAAIGAVGYGILDTHGDQKALPTASVAKVMTALAVLKQHPLKVGDQGPMITITQDDVDYYQKVVSEDGSNTPVALGEQISEYQALQALLLPSSNNMAHTVAVWAYGSQEAYVTYVNNFAKSLGMNNAHFDDASGFSSKTVATAEDLARLAVNAMDNPVIAEIAAQPDAEIPVAGKIYNVNMLLGKSGIVGLKTGNTDQAGGCFMAAAEREIGGQKIIAITVVMGSTTLGQALHDSVPLITSVFDGFEAATLVKAKQTVGSYSMPWGSKVDVQASKDVSGVVWSGSPTKAELELKGIPEPKHTIPGQTQVGIARGTFGRNQVKVPVLTTQQITPPNFLWRFKPRFL